MGLDVVSGVTAGIGPGQWADFNPTHVHRHGRCFLCLFPTVPFSSVSATSPAAFFDALQSQTVDGLCFRFCLHLRFEAQSSRHQGTRQERKAHQSSGTHFDDDSLNCLLHFGLFLHFSDTDSCG